MARITAKGRAVIIAIVCNPWRPPLSNRIMAIADWRTPQMILILFLGLRSPLEESIPRTKVAESAEVIKKVIISKVASRQTTVLNGSFLKVINKAEVISASTALVIPCWPLITRLRAVPPKTENHKKLNKLGANKTPKTNSLIVLPFDTLAMNIPTKGAQAIHHDQ